jgi:hypothetical protein
MTPTLPTDPLRYAPGIERPEADEAEVTQEIIDEMGKVARTVFRHSGHAERGVHAKSHGLLRGELRVLDGLPPALAQGLFAAPATYPVVLRLSTNPGDVLDDDVSTPRGLGLKVIGVAGERLPDAPGANQDFVMANAPAFSAATPKAFLKSLKLLAATTDKPQILKKAVSAVMRGAEAALETVGGHSATLLGLGGQPRTHILGETFYSQVPMRYGDHVAKIQVRPASPNLRALTGAPLDHRGDPDALRDAVAEVFAGAEAEWELCVQLATASDSMPIEDASAVWPEDESPYVPVARITVPAQESWTEETHRRIDDAMAFSPWHGLAAHRPLGAVMRVRKAVYEASARFRAEANHVTITEPDRDGARA